MYITLCLACPFKHKYIYMYREWDKWFAAATNNRSLREFTKGFSICEEKKSYVCFT